MNDGAADVLTQNEVGSYLEARVDVAVRLGDSMYSAIQSAISFLYRQSGIDSLTELKGGISLYCKGSKSKGGHMKQVIELKISGGKKQTPQEVSRLFSANQFFTSRKKEHIFAHLFLILDW